MVRLVVYMCFSHKFRMISLEMLRHVETIFTVQNEFKRRSDKILTELIVACLRYERRDCYEIWNIR